MASIHGRGEIWHGRIAQPAIALAQIARNGIDKSV